MAKVFDITAAAFMLPVREKPPLALDIGILFQLRIAFRFGYSQTDKIMEKSVDEDSVDTFSLEFMAHSDKIEIHQIHFFDSPEDIEDPSGEKTPPAPLHGF